MHARTHTLSRSHARTLTRARVRARADTHTHTRTLTELLHKQLELHDQRHSRGERGSAEEDYVPDGQTADSLTAPWICGTATVFSIYSIDGFNGTVR